MKDVIVGFKIKVVKKSHTLINFVINLFAV